MFRRKKKPVPPEAKPLYDHGIPSPERQGFISLSSMHTAVIDTTDAIETVAKQLGTPSHYTDAEGYEVEITAATVHPDEGWLAWVESRAKQYKHYKGLKNYVDVTFHLKALVNDRLAIKWEVETYNPFFGCMVGFIGWFAQNVVIIYREKHHTYVAVAPITQKVKRAKLADDWAMIDNVIGYRPYGETDIRRIQVPDLKELPSLSEAEAVKAGFVIAEDID